MNVSRAYPERPIVGVGAIIVRDGRIVLVKRRYDPLAGRWSLPGGGVELAETLAQAVVREVLEETGLEVSVGPVVEVVDRIYRDPDGRVAYHYVLIDYLCEETGGTMRAGSDAADIALVSAEELGEYRITGGTRAIIDKALAMARPAAPLTRP
jgi:mutator protein MutT